jgi:formylglycine-generating enzyme required for sulfatase activity/tRNA A-37 threonylcarbamoyl transferase component Bud32
MPPTPLSCGGEATLMNLLVDQQSRWRRGERMPVEAYLARQAHLRGDSEALLELILHEVLLRQERGETPDLAEYQQRFPHLSEQLLIQFEVERAIEAEPPVTQTRVQAQPGTLLSLPRRALPAPYPSGARLSRDPSDDPPVPRSTGVRIPGYEILGELGRGGMGVVCKARHLRLNRIVALKMVLSGGQATPEERLRFLAEAEAIAAVKHPGIVQVHDFGTHNGVPYLSLEFCPGGSLAGKLSGNPLPAREAAALVEQVARAVQAAHEAGIVHRDLKPANVLLDEQGRPKVTDFGLAKRCELGAGLTQTGAVLGTPSYMAPEQAQGKKDVGCAADVWALGAILYECLTGRPPFKACTIYDTILQVVNDEPVPPRQLSPAVSRDLETICLKCLNKDPGRRYASAADLADDLHRLLAGAPIAARPVSRTERAIKWARRRPAVAALLAASLLCAVGLVVLSGVAVWQWRTAVAALNSKDRALQGERQARHQEEQERARRALAQVDALLSANSRAVPALLDDFNDQPDEVAARLRQVWNQPSTPRNRPGRMRAALALLPVEPGLVRDSLLEWMLEVPDPAELLVIRDALQLHAAQLRGKLWRRLEQKGTPRQRLHILAALAGFDPAGTPWKKAAGLVLEPWLSADHLDLDAWTEALRPARASLLGPLTEVFTGKRLREFRHAAAGILTDYARDRPEILAQLIVEADDHQFATLLPVLQPHRNRIIPLLTREVERPAQEQEAPREAQARRQAGAALALLKLGEAKRVWPLLRHSHDPEARSRLIHRLGKGGVPAETLAAQLELEADVSIRRALILALGEFTAEQVSPPLRQRLVRTLLAWYRDDPDAGIHGAIDWLLRHDREGTEARPLAWGQARELQRIDETLRRGGAEGKRNWYVNAQGQTFTVLDARQPFLMGSPADEAGRGDNEMLHWRQIGRRFAIAARPVTVTDFARFHKMHPEVQHSYPRQYSPVPDGPIITVTWYEAAQYCRWLSEQEGFPEHEMVYPSVAEIEKCKDGVIPLRLPANHLKRKGYRLPAEAEWEFACRAGARTSRYYGSSQELLPHYAWFQRNSKDRTWPVGQKKPNDFGLFDMHGNAWTWCQESTSPYSAATLDRPQPSNEDSRDVSDSLKRALRGASFFNLPPFMRAAYRSDLRPTVRIFAAGIRVARTCDD